MHPSLHACAALLLLATALSGQTAAPAARSWTDTQGRTMQAAFIALEGAQVIFQMATGQTLRFPLSKLSEADQKYVAALAGSQPASPAPAAANNPRLPPDKRTWPAIVEVPTKSIDITTVEENPDQKRCIYRSEAFEFISEDKLAAIGVVREIARTFESTRALLQALPWGIDPQPPPDIGRYRAKFYASRESYQRDGGPPNSGGAYMVADRIFKIPFDSLGLKRVGKTWTQDRDYRNNTIIHEITHQLMHEYLAMLPLWVSEGTAEYTQSLPYNAGKFQAAKHESGLKAYIKLFGDNVGLTTADFRPVDQHLKMPREQWNQLAQDPAGGYRSMALLYFQSYLTVYYFCHLDGDGKGTRFLKYLDALAAERPKWAEYEVKFAAYRKAMEDFLKLPGVTLLGDGRFSYPNNLTPPTAPEPPGKSAGSEIGLENLPLLYDGRTGAELETQMKEGFKKIGVKW